MIAILLDQGLAPATAAILHDRGLDAVHCSGDRPALRGGFRYSGRRQGPESRLCHLGSRLHTHLAVAGQGRPSVSLLRVEGLGSAAQANLIESICLTCEGALNDARQFPPMAIRCGFGACRCAESSFADNAVFTNEKRSGFNSTVRRSRAEFAARSRFFVGAEGILS
jgi:hypothetical protein